MYGKESVTRLGLRGRFMDLDRKYARLKEQLWDHPVDPKEDENFESILDDLRDLCNYSGLAIPVLRDEAGKKYKKSEYKDAAALFLKFALTLDPEMRKPAPYIEPKLEMEAEETASTEPEKKSKPVVKNKRTRRSEVERKLKLLDGDDIAETAFDASTKIDGMTAEAASLMMYSWAKLDNLGKGGETNPLSSAQLKPKAIAKKVVNDDDVVDSVMKHCGLSDKKEMIVLAEKFFEFALVELDIIEGDKAADPKQMTKTAKADPEVIGRSGDDTVLEVND